jgi:hypothetical protein
MMMAQNKKGNSTGGLMRKFKNSFRKSDNNLSNSEQREDNEVSSHDHLETNLNSPAGYSVNSSASVEVRRENSVI